MASSSRWSFQCAGPKGEDLCLNGGQCVTDPGTARQWCNCRAGYRADFDWFHFPNCARTSNAGLIVFVFAAVVYLSILLYVCLALLPTLRKDLRVLGFVHIGYCIMLFIFGLSFYVEDGCHALCGVFSNLAFIAAAWVTTLLILMVMKPLYAVRMRPIQGFRERFLAWTVFLSVVFIGTGVSMAVLSNDVARIDEYNMAAYASTLMLWVGGMVQLITILVTAARLRKEVQSMQKAQVLSTVATQRSKTSDAVMSRLRMLQMGSLVVLGPFVTLFVITPIILAMLGSFPYFYVITYLEYGSTMAFACGVTYFLRHPPSSANSESTSPRMVMISTGALADGDGQPQTHPHGTTRGKTAFSSLTSNNQSFNEGITKPPTAAANQHVPLSLPQV